MEPERLYTFRALIGFPASSEEEAQEMADETSMSYAHGADISFEIEEKPCEIQDLETGRIVWTDTPKRQPPAATKGD